MNRRQDDFTVGRILLRRSWFGLWTGRAAIRNMRAFTLQRTRAGAELWADRLIRESAARVWASCNSPRFESMSLCDEQATR